MGHSYSSSFFHIVFSTKDRRRCIDAKLRERLFPYLGGIARENGMQLLAAGGVEDHVHCLVVIPANLALSKAVQLLKGVSSKWIHETFPEQRQFAWQEGYGAFSISVSRIEDTINYIRRQEEHHRSRTFEEEFVAFLQRHRLEFDRRHVFG
jgi:REP element-mobilizing transposase RayT